MNKRIFTLPAATGVAAALALGSALSLSAARSEAGCCNAPKLLAQATVSNPAGNTKTVNLTIEGMSCGACAASIKSALQKLDGIKKIDITFEKKGGTVEFDPAKVDETKIVEAINKTDFKAKASKSQLTR